MPTPTGWYSRGYHPHLNTPGLVQSVTTHLGDSIATFATMGIWPPWCGMSNAIR
jgi:hypothetical protein